MSDELIIDLSLELALAYTNQVSQAKSVNRVQQHSKESHEGEDEQNIKICDEELSQMFGKGDFSRLKVVGQFNKSFMLCKLGDSDLFILDQHACDEKYNFEQLSTTTVLHTQDLINPIKIQLSVTDALAVNLHREVFLFNGWKVVSVEEEKMQPENSLLELRNEEMHIEASSNEFLIKSVPHSKQTLFTTDDFMELVQIINEHLDYSKDDFSTTSFRVGVTDRSPASQSYRLSQSTNRLSSYSQSGISQS